MRLLAIEHSQSEYRADFIIYGVAWLALLTYLGFATPAPLQWRILGLTGAGIVTWSLLEYLLHRFVLHGLRPFSDWHGAHHRHPTALICTPTVLSAALMVSLIFLPALAASDALHACGLSFGMLSGYLGYTLTHHAMHHGRAADGWLLTRRRCHALHHAAGSGHYGVTSPIWDQVFGSGRRAAR